jgi:flavin reductase (DIM6/NTAB) family NADH-FMN oxidoreductase RutF
MSADAIPVGSPARFRRALGRFATGVTVVTTPTGGAPHGMTANGFMSVSLDPPLVLVSLTKQSRLFGFLAETRRFGVSILSEDQETLSRHFGGRPQEGLELDFAWAGGLPFVPGALGQIGCRVVDEHPAGDHILVIGEVEHLDYRDGAPLLFFTGTYGFLHVGLSDDIFFY